MITPTLMLAGALLAAPAAAQPPCRALVNLQEGPSAGPAEGQIVLDVRFGGSGTPTITHQRGLAIGQGRTIRQLRTLGDADYATRSGSTWSLLQAMDPQSQAVATWAGKPVAAMPTEGPDDDFYGTFLIGASSTFGPYIAVSRSGVGYAGGAHMFDDGDWQLLGAPDGKPVDPLSLIDPAEALATAQALVTKANLDEPPEISAQTLARATLIPKSGGLQLVDTMECCTWAENHNQFELEAPVKVPKALEAVIPHDATGWLDGGQQCRLRHQDGQLSLAWGPSGTHAVAAPGRLLGVAWVDPGAPALRPFKVDKAGAQDALKRARKWLDVVNDAPVATAAAQRAMTLAPDDMAIAVEAAWIHFVAKSGATPADAEALTRRALTQLTAKDNKLIGMARYNLGRMLEKKGDIAGARAEYALSLKARPHKVVEARLKSLDAPKP